MSEQKRTIVFIDSTQVDNLPENMVVFLVPDIKKMIMLPESELEEFRKEALSDHLLERELEPQDLELFTDLLDNGYRAPCDTAFIYQQEAPEVIPVINTMETMNDFKGSFPRKIAVSMPQQHFNQNKNFNQKINSRSKARNWNTPRR